MNGPGIRRGLLATATNPSARLDYVVTLAGSLPGPCPARLRLRYVPDRLILRPTALPPYLEHLGGMGWDSLEAAAAILLDDVMDETVARWVQVRLTAENPACGHCVLIEDRHPRWDNAPLLARLGEE
ncbi:hypothetical protein [Telmatospirillum sp. J64-1]|uniref:hypothetical protein n=1 Tax=Telmatospirillum sp. J64-1 TaxID=2502183 RepID=UPI00115DC595|nr:hypothetical protein [Telmatospirillum sp. J64-1]